MGSKHLSQAPQPTYPKIFIGFKFIVKNLI